MILIEPQKECDWPHWLGSNGIYIHNKEIQYLS